VSWEKNSNGGKAHASGVVLCERADYGEWWAVWCDYVSGQIMAVSSLGWRCVDGTSAWGAGNVVGAACGKKYSRMSRWPVAMVWAASASPPH
jgi:hypothetical protein